MNSVRILGQHLGAVARVALEHFGPLGQVGDGGHPLAPGRGDGVAAVVGAEDRRP